MSPCPCIGLTDIAGACASPAPSSVDQQSPTVTPHTTHGILIPNCCCVYLTGGYGIASLSSNLLSRCSFAVLRRFPPRLFFPLSPAVSLPTPHSTSQLVGKVFGESPEKVHPLSAAGLWLWALVLPLIPSGPLLSSHPPWAILPRYPFLPARPSPARVCLPPSATLGALGVPVSRQSSHCAHCGQSPSLTTHPPYLRTKYPTVPCTPVLTTPYRLASTALF